MTQERDFPPISPGKMLERRIGEIEGKISQDALAASLGVSRFTVNQIINGHRAVTPDMAVRLAYVLGTSPELWLTAQMHLDLYHARRRTADTLRDLTPLMSPELSPPD